MNVLEIDIDKVPSAVLRQLIEEVRTEMIENQPHAYDRCHCRHNRGRGKSGEETIAWAESIKEE